MTLLQNGNRRIINGGSETVIESMSIFSWFMTIVTCAMDATLQLKSMNRAMSSFLTKLFEEHIDGLDYLQRELPQHIQGWVSAAVVRNITPKARNVWQSLLERKVRLPGWIPEEDVPELVNFLIWLAGARKQTWSRRFETTSSDVFSFAVILQSLGFDMIDIRTLPEDDIDSTESRLVVQYLPDVIATRSANTEDTQKWSSRQQERFGMRIPLECMEECVSVWPGTYQENNLRRELFKDGLAASSSISVVAYRFESRGKDIRPGYMLSDNTHRFIGRTDSAVYRIVSELFPIPNPALISTISAILVQGPNLRDGKGTGIFRRLSETPESLSKVQVFVLGYYYGMLKEVLDHSKLSLPEVYGSWKWFDAHLLGWIRIVLQEHLHKISTGTPKHGETFFQREGILKLLGKLFAGAEEDQLRALDDSAIGIHGKISVVTNGLFGSITSKESAMRFCLLDTDQTAIPSTVRGIISGGSQDLKIRKPLMLCDDDLQEIAEVDFRGAREDFTSHIEPDWENDIQQCQVVFRYKGRIIGRIAPTSLMEVWMASTRELAFTPQKPPTPLKVYVAKIANLVDNCPQPDFGSADFNPDQPSILIPTQNLVKARTFLLAHYHLTGYRLFTLPGPWTELRAPEHINQGDPDSPIILYSDLNPHLTDEMKSGKCIILA
jgi:hypothetical protein